MTDKKTEALKLALGYMDGTLMTEHLTGYERKRHVMQSIREALTEQPAQQDITCNKKLREQGKAYPRTCKKCGLGPCIADRVQPAPQQEPVTVLPDGSAFAVMSYPLPKDHWLYADRQYNDGEYEPVELGKPVLTHELRDAVVSAVRYAIRGATNCGKEVDFDPDALVQNAVYALCGPFTSPPASKPWVGLTEKERKEIYRQAVYVDGAIRMTEAKLKEKNQ